MMAATVPRPTRAPEASAASAALKDLLRDSIVVRHGRLAVQDKAHACRPSEAFNLGRQSRRSHVGRSFMLHVTEIWYSVFEGGTVGRRSNEMPQRTVALRPEPQKLPMNGTGATRGRIGSDRRGGT